MLGEIQIEEIKDVYRDQRSNIDSLFDAVYNEAQSLAEKVGVEPQMPRNASTMRHRSNIPADSVKQYYLRNLAVPFVDYINNELDSKLTGTVLFFKPIYC